MEHAETPTFPGLKWRPRQRGRVPYWLPRAEAVKLGYPSTAISLESFADSPGLLSEKCHLLQGKMLAWLSTRKADANTFDGTIGAALRIYQKHDESPYQTLKPGTLEPYNVYLRRLEPHIGKVKVGSVTALDVKRWHAIWSKNGTRPAAGHICLAVLKSALTFCIVAGHRECRQLRDDIGELRVAGPRRRNTVATAEQVVAARRAAHDLGRPSAALCYAFQFETALRLWDVTGQWLPLSDPTISTVIDGNRKWAGLEWRHIGPDLVLRFRPSKTSGTSGAEVVIDLSICPMVLEEIERIPAEKRVGPIVIHERHRRPYTRHESSLFWRQVRTKAGIPAEVWCRDLRSSAITEARGYGADISDASKVAGHTKPTITADVYDRAHLEAHRRFATARVAKRGIRE
jgi:hypothetical protein